MVLMNRRAPAQCLAYEVGGLGLVAVFRVDSVILVTLRMAALEVGLEL
jgi:hypothetical protein